MNVGPEDVRYSGGVRHDGGKRHPTEKEDRPCTICGEESDECVDDGESWFFYCRRCPRPPFFGVVIYFKYDPWSRE